MGGGYAANQLVSQLLSKTDWHLFYDYHEWGTSRVNWIGQNLRMTGPYNLPLWFLRDLIVVSILTPFIYYVVRKLKLKIVVLLFFAYISRIWTLVPGLNITACFFFVTGAFFALNSINIVKFSNKYKLIFVPVSLILLIITIVFDGANTVIGQNVYPLFVCSGVFTAFYVASSCIQRFNIRPNKVLVSSCFFLYAFHGADLPIIGSPLSFVTKYMHNIIPGSSGIEEVICYLASPLVTAILLVLLLLAFRRILPKTALLFSGNK